MSEMTQISNPKEENTLRLPLELVLKITKLALKSGLVDLMQTNRLDRRGKTVYIDLVFALALVDKAIFNQVLETTGFHNRIVEKGLRHEDVDPENLEDLDRAVARYYRLNYVWWPIRIVCASLEKHSKKSAAKLDDKEAEDLCQAISCIWIPSEFLNFLQSTIFLGDYYM